VSAQSAISRLVIVCAMGTPAMIIAIALPAVMAGVQPQAASPPRRCRNTCQHRPAVPVHRHVLAVACCTIVDQSAALCNGASNGRACDVIQGNQLGPLPTEQQRTHAAVRAVQCIGALQLVYLIQMGCRRCGDPKWHPPPYTLPTHDSQHMRKKVIWRCAPSLRVCSSQHSCHQPAVRKNVVTHHLTHHSTHNGTVVCCTQGPKDVTALFQ
jgi:hypothetical protein